MSADRDQFISIQYLRAIAALMVVIHHARNPKEWLFNPLESYGAFAWGVDIFFVISGFIMYAAARRESPVNFFVKRLIRIVPLYWAVTIFLLLVNVRFQVWTIDGELWSHVLKSLFFIPHYSLSSPDRIWPYLIVGWTLNYEMLFYLIFCVGLMFQRTLMVCTVTILGLFVTGLVTESANPLVQAYTHPILLEFLCGVWAAHAYLKGYLKQYLSVCALLGFTGLFLLPLAGDDYESMLIMGGRIVCSSAIVVGAIVIGKSVPKWRTLNRLGDASYSIYLTHGIALVLSNVLLSRLPLQGWYQLSGKILLALLVSSVVGLLVYRYLEKPSMRWFRGGWEKLRARTSTRREEVERTGSNAS